MLQTRLKALGALKGRPTRKARSLMQLCHQGRLSGGLSIALDVTPDEAFSAVTHTMQLQGLKLLDVRGGGEQLEVRLHDGSVERWQVEGVEGLVHNLNQLARLQPEARRCAVLGEWEDMLQLWCASLAQLAAGLHERWLDARNPTVLLAPPAGFF